MTKIMRDFRNNLLFGEDPTNLPWFFHRFVIFILKPGKPTTCEDSYRGLSMLEAFFKIFSKIISDRMKRSMIHIQSPQQIGFTQGKGIQEATRTVCQEKQSTPYSSQHRFLQGIWLNEYRSHRKVLRNLRIFWGVHQGIHAIGKKWYCSVQN